MSIINEFVSGSKQVHTSHSVQEFIDLGMQVNEYTSYEDLAYIEKRNGIEFVTKQIIDDYWPEINALLQEITLAPEQQLKYRYNPKLLAYDLYKSTALFYFILKANNMCNVHEFSLSSGKVKLLSKSDMKSVLNKIYSSENQSLMIFRAAHKDDVIDTPINKYVYERSNINRFLNLS